MINPNQAIIVYKHFLKDVLRDEYWYKNIAPFLKATLLYGSVAKGTNHENSDIDILLILPLEIEKKFTKGEYVYKHNIYEINIVLRSVERLRMIAKENKDELQREVFKHSIIITSFDDEVENLVSQIENI